MKKQNFFKAETLMYKNNEEFYVPDPANFTAVNTGTAGGSDRPKATRIPITKFAVGQRYAGVIQRRKLDHEGQFGVSDLYYFKRVLGGSSQQGNLQLSETEDLIALDGNVVLKEELRKQEDGRLIIIEYLGQAPPPKRYKMWKVYVDQNYRASFQAPVQQQYTPQPQQQAPNNFVQQQYAPQSQPQQYAPQPQPQQYAPNTGAYGQPAQYPQGQPAHVQGMQGQPAYGSPQPGVVDDLPF